MSIDLYNDNCMTVLKNMPTGIATLAILDPPYLIETEGGGIAVDGTVPQWKEHDLDDLADGFDFAVLDELCRVLKKINMYIFCSQKQIMPLLDYFVTKRNCNWNLITWHKINPVPACGNKYLTDTEYCLFFREKGVKIFGTYDTKRTWYATKSNAQEKELYNHPTVKWLPMIENFVINSSEIDDLVIDPFLGSGTTGVACKNLNRSFIGCEINPTYYEVAKQRIGEAVSHEADTIITVKNNEEQLRLDI